MDVSPLQAGVVNGPRWRHLGRQTRCRRRCYRPLFLSRPRRRTAPGCGRAATTATSNGRRMDTSRHARRRWPRSLGVGAKARYRHERPSSGKTAPDDAAGAHRRVHARLRGWPFLSWTFTDWSSGRHRESASTRLLQRREQAHRGRRRHHLSPRLQARLRRHRF